MIVRHFLQWLRTAGAGERAEATGALARAYLYSDLSHDDRVAAEGAMVMLLDDPSPLVRFALGAALAGSADAPPSVILSLAADQPDIATLVIARSPLLLDADLVDIVGSGRAWAQAAVARRGGLPRAVAAAIAEVGTPEACLLLIENTDADIAAFSFDRLAERHGDLAVIREALFRRGDVPAATRQTLVTRLSDKLAAFVASRAWLDESRARHIAQDACEKATVILAGCGPSAEVRPLIAHLRQTGQLTAGLILRALLCGNVQLFEEALAELSGMPLTRVSGLVHDSRGGAFRALYDKAGLPASAYRGFRVALDAMGELGFAADSGAATLLKRRMVERVLTACEDELPSEIESLLALLRRFATEAAREEARRLCSELAAA